MKNIQFFRDFSLSSLIAGFITVLVGFTSSAVFIIQAAQGFSASSAEISSWFWAFGLGIGLSGLALSLYYKLPIATAWSTPGAAVLIAGSAGISLNQAIGAFITCGVLIAVVGFSGLFARISRYIPSTLASAMLAGLLFKFGLNIFSAIPAHPVLVLGMCVVYLIGKRLFSRYAILLTLLLGVGVAFVQGNFSIPVIPLSLTTPIFTAPEWSLSVMVGLGLPLFIVTMTSQNVPGIAMIQAAGYKAPVSAATGVTGIATTVFAPFGAFAINLAAISAAICLGEEAHADKQRRYVAAVCAAVFYILIGLFGASITAVFMAFPPVLITTLAGLALFATISQGLGNAFKDESQREPALITFLLTASGVSFFGLSAAFWGLLAGMASHWVLSANKK